MIYSGDTPFWSETLDICHACTYTKQAFTAHSNMQHISVTQPFHDLHQTTFYFDLSHQIHKHIHKHLHIVQHFNDLHQLLFNLTFPNRRTDGGLAGNTKQTKHQEVWLAQAVCCGEQSQGALLQHRERQTEC